MGLYQGDKPLSAGKSPVAYAKDAGYAGTDTNFYTALADMPDHISDTENPHGTTASQVGAYTKGEINTLLQKKADKDRVVNPNLLDNWCFGNPVDQKGGYVVPPNTPYYIPGETTPSGVTSGYTKVECFLSANNGPFFTIDNTRYATIPGTAVRGYTGTGYGIDRWNLLATQFAVTIENDGVTLHRNGGDQWIYAQPLEPKLVTALTGKSVVISTLTDAGLVELPVSSAFTAEQSVVSTSGTCIWLSTAGYLFLGTTADSVKLKAVKLELGDTQTLAHQDSSGKWVLNGIPDYGEQLALCQRRQCFFNPSGKSVSMIGNGQAYRSDVIFVNFTLPTTMAEDGTPILENLDISKIQLRGAGQNLIPTSVAIDGASHGSSFSIVCAVSGATAGAAYDMILFDYNNLGITNNL